MSLHTQALGDHGSLVVFCHGLFGQGKNWTQVARSLTPDHRALLVDMPNHGRSGWTEEFDYVAAADQVATLLDPDDPVALVGHSMGGKIAMLLALRHPGLVERLCIVDVAPVAYSHASEFAGYIDAMLGVDLSSLTRRDEADAALTEVVPDRGVRSFLLQNLRREGEGWSWQPHLSLLRRELDTIGGWPEEALETLEPYEGPVLWIGGSRSGYVRDENAPTMDRWFPRNRRVTIKDAGHWVHAEQPEVFREVLRRFVGPGDAARG